MNKRKKIFINASTVLISGGYILSLRIIQSLINEGSFELYIVCPSLKKYSTCKSENSYIIIVPRWLLKRVFRIILDRIWLPKLIHKIDPEIVFSLTNLPAITKYRQIYLHDNPYFPERNMKGVALTRKEYYLQKIKSYITHKRLNSVYLIIVQSEYFKTLLLEETKQKIPIKIITPANHVEHNKKNTEIPYYLENNKYKILCLSRYFEHKNIEILVKLGQLIQEGNYPFVIYLTINEKRNKKVQDIIKSIRSNKLNQILVNFGKIQPKDTGNYIKQCDAMILPSLLESFSLNYIEAWAYRKPLFVTDNPANRSACKEAAFYFDPFNEKDILKALLQLRQTDLILGLIRKGERRLMEISKWGDYVNLLEDN